MRLVERMTGVAAAGLAGIAMMLAAMIVGGYEPITRIVVIFMCGAALAFLAIGYGLGIDNALRYTSELEKRANGEREPDAGAGTGG